MPLVTALVSVLGPDPTNPVRASGCPLPSALPIGGPIHDLQPYSPVYTPDCSYYFGAPLSPFRRQLSYAELTRRPSAPAGDGHAHRTLSRVRRTSNAGTGAAVAGTAAGATGSTWSPSAGVRAHLELIRR